MAEGARVYVMPGPIGDRKVYLVRQQEQEKPDHPAVEISVSLQDSVHWVSNEGRFRVKELKAIDYQDPTCLTTDRQKDPISSASEKDLVNAPTPFYRNFPDENREYAFQISSGPARPECIGYTYEAHFEFEDGAQTDPHIHIGP